MGLCETVGVRGYPTIKHGDPSSLEDYKGGRDFDALKKFTDGLKPLCSPSNLDLCDATQAAEIKKLMALPVADLEAQIKEKDAAIADLEKSFEKEVEDLQSQYQEYTKEKEDGITAIKDSGLSLMKAVKTTLQKEGKTDL